MTADYDNSVLKWSKNNKIFIAGDSAPGTVSVAIENDADELTLEKVRVEFQGKVKVSTCSADKIQQLQRRQAAAVPVEFTEDSLRNSPRSWEAAPIINLVETLLEDALKRHVTDIHLEPSEKCFRIRFRKDGLLESYKELPLWTSDAILVRLKILSDIDIADKRIPHDGSFTFCGLLCKVNIRVSTLPVQGGEKCVLRLLPQKADDDLQSTGLAALSLSDSLLSSLRRIFNSPQGLFLVTGPTGSGKTTTLHAGLQEIAQKQINITTIEDPVEYQLRGINQVQVNEKCGFTFAEALRSILRQDPDVILVGEIRDEETAQIALRAAQTGHLVLSTLHTNSSRAAYTRLGDLGIDKKLLDDSLLGILAQRLVRQKMGGRRAVTELLLPDGTFADGTLKDAAVQLIRQNVIEKEEALRVLGNLFYIGDHENF